MKLAVAGKGGVGKSTLAAALALLLARRGRRVLALDADPDANLAAALGMPGELQRSILPLSAQRALVEERTGAKVKQYGQMFKMNPEVGDIAGRHAVVHAGVALLVLGAIEAGGSGCACPENVLMRALVQDLVLHQGDAVIMDFEAGIEHLGRASARGVDMMVVVVDSSRRSIDCAQRVFGLARQIGLEDVRVVANRIAAAEEERFIRAALPGRNVLGVIPDSAAIRAADRDGRSVLDGLEAETLERFDQVLKNIELAVAR